MCVKTILHFCDEYAPYADWKFLLRNPAKIRLTLIEHLSFRLTKTHTVFSPVPQLTQTKPPSTHNNSTLAHFKHEHLKPNHVLCGKLHDVLSTEPIRSPCVRMSFIECVPLRCRRRHEDGGLTCCAPVSLNMHMHRSAN